MSEKVQLALERFLPELRDLEQKKVFNKAEINEIVQKRRAFEVSLANGRSTKPLDYLRYIEYESKLERLRRARVIRLQLTAKKSRSDYSIQFHITQLHRLSVRRFPESLLLWDAYISHALTQDSPLLVSRTISAAIAMHPTHTAYWIMASQWESEGDSKGMGGGNTEGARRLCMRALRFLKKGKKKVLLNQQGEEEMGIEGDEEKIWKEWLRVEISFVEKLKARQKVLGLGKPGEGGEEIVRVKGKRVKEDGEEEEEEEDQGVELPEIEGEEGEDIVQLEVEQKVLSGQEAILDGAIVRAVIDNLLMSYDYSLFSYRFLLSILRPIPSTLRLSLLAHVYSSLTIHLDPLSPSYPSFFDLYTTRHLYDVPYNPPKASKKRKLEEVEVASAEDPNAVKVEGEKLVDAVGKVAGEYWKVLKKNGRKSKGKGKAKEGEGESIVQKVWEHFAAWLEEMAEETEDEDLLAFLTANLNTTFTLAPLSPFLALIHLRLLLRTDSPSEEVLAIANQMVKSFGTDRTPPTSREQIWVARIETSLSLSSTSPDQVVPLVNKATQVLPFSSKIWDLSAEITEQTLSSPESISAWYESSIRRSLLTDALPPSNFTSSFPDFIDLAPRELLPRRFVHYLSTTLPASLETTLLRLFSSAPTLSLSFLSYVLSLSGPSSSASRRFRRKVHERIVEHPEASSEEWVEYANELMRDGEVKKCQEVLGRAKGLLKVRKGEGEVKAFEREWEAVCSAMEE